ncbi:hypothetical protein P4310_31285, partial [Bacillus thuringiensis]|nr:hypothetical protein [Bacillus thuringiensis]
NNKLIIEVNADKNGALEGIKEVTEAANECTDALEKLEKVMSRFKGKSALKDITVECPIVLNGKTMASEIVKRINDSNSNIQI